jgi:hypothetical protein
MIRLLKYILEKAFLFRFGTLQEYIDFSVYEKMRIERYRPHTIILPKGWIILSKEKVINPISGKERPLVTILDNCGQRAVFVGIGIESKNKNKIIFER